MMVEYYIQGQPQHAHETQAILTLASFAQSQGISEATGDLVFAQLGDKSAPN